MRYVVFEQLSDNVGTVTGLYAGVLPAGIVGGIETEALDPIKETYPNLEPVMRIRLDTKELYYDYISRENTETRLAQTQSELTDVQQALADTYEQLALTQLENTNTQAAMSDLYEQLLLVQAELESLKGGGE